ncbi:MAG TPA: Rossmann-like and DUF2520 domain-containing protein [Gemmatimonadales bacterium]|nr:Rossmann-like and DUF2520 domain-containing protein [Gemmatimonadales bacterium]
MLGPGRMGQGIAIALGATGHHVRLFGRGASQVVPPLVLYPGTWHEATRGAHIVLVATPDGAIADAAEALRAGDAVGPNHAVLHLSGVLDRSALAALTPTGAALGSFHPLQTVADATTAAARLKGAWAGLEGDPGALEAGERLAGWLGMRAVRLSADSKPLYHAAAVFVSNYTVALAAVAARLAQTAGVPADTADRIYHPLLAGTAENLQSSSPAVALTGPIARGDLETVRRHLSALAGDERTLYRLLGLETLALAREAGLEPDSADALERLLQSPPS